MSFNDLERGPTSSSTPVRGAGVGGALLPTQQAVDPEFKRLADRTAIQILKINSNVANIDRLLSLSSRSQPKDWSARITALLDSTRDLIHHSTADVKTLSTQYAAPGAHADKPELQQQQYKATVSKLQTDFEAALRGFQRVQKGSAERSRRTLDAEREKERRLKSEAGGDRTSVVSNAGSSAGGPSSAATGAAGARYKDSPNDTALVEFSSPRNDSQALLDDAGGEQQQQQQQQQQLQAVVEGPSQADIEFQEALIAEREAEIREIEGGVHELNEIFRDLANIVQEQGGMIDNIEYNITSIATNTQAADRELVQAHEYQRKAGRRALCLLLVVGFVIAVVLLALLS